jgi:hypothetical protein
MMARKKIEVDLIPDLLTQAEEAQVRGREILDELQIVADGPFWEGTSPQYVRYKG